MGIAMGCVGMSMHDFERCTPSEFREAFDAWMQNRDLNNRDEWERTRMLCMCALLPYSKKSLKPTDIIRFSWEKKSEDSQKSKIETMDEIKANFEKAKKRLGLE